MTKPYLLFIESNTSGSGEDFIKTAQRLGFKTLLLVNDIKRYPWASALTDYAELDTNDFETLSEYIITLQARDNVAGVLTSSEYYVHTVARVAEKFGLSGLSPSSVEDARNKNRMRSILKENGLNSINYAKISKDDDIAAKTSHLSFPIIVKPVSGSGSENVILCSDMASVLSHLNTILSETHNARGQINPDFVALEEYIDGPEYSVEIICSPQPVAITVVQKHLTPEPHFLETGHDIPAQLNESDRALIIDEACKAVKALGLKWGCIHVELRMSHKGPIIIEVNPRLAGGMIPTLIQYSYDIDMIELQVKSAAGHDVSSDDLPSLKTYSSIRFIIPPENGKLLHVDGLDNVASLPGVKKAYTDSRAKTFSVLKGDFTDRIGAIIVTDDDQNKCIALIEDAVKNIDYIYNVDKGATA
jgi:biotin carboxylase